MKSALLTGCLTISIVSQGEYTGEIKGGMRPSMKLIVMGIINKKPKRLVRAPVLCCFRVLLTNRLLHMTWQVIINTSDMTAKVLFWQKNAMPVHLFIP